MGIVVFGVGSACLDLGVHLWAWWAGRPSPSWNPVELIVALLGGSLMATTGMWVCVGVRAPADAGAMRRRRWSATGAIRSR